MNPGARNGLRRRFLPVALAAAMALACGCDRRKARAHAESGGPASAAPAVSFQTSAGTLPDFSGPLPNWEIQLAASDLRRLDSDPYSNETLPAVFLAGNAKFEGARIRHRGAWARGWPKKPLKIFFEHEHEFEKQHCLNFNSGWRDPAFVREVLAYAVYARCGAPAPQARPVRLSINGQFRGLYIQVEQPGKPFLKRYALKGAAIYKANSPSNSADERDLGAEQAAHYEKETQKDQKTDELSRFCHELAVSRNLLDFFQRRVDLEKYINYLAATVLVQHWDGFNKNHFLVCDSKGSGQWFAVPWDLDRTFGDVWNGPFDEYRLPILLGTRKMPGVTGWNRLEDRFFSVPALREQFLDRLEALLKTEFTPERLFPVIDQLEQQIHGEVRAEYQRWRRPDSDLQRGIEGLKSFIEARREFLLAEIPRLRR